MAEYISNTSQTVEAGEYVALQTTAEKGGCYIIHTNGSPLISLRGSNCCIRPNVYDVSVHVTVSGSDTVPVQLALAVDGVPLPETTIAFPEVSDGTLLSGSVTTKVQAAIGTKLAIIALTDITVETVLITVDKE